MICAACASYDGNRVIMVNMVELKGYGVVSIWGDNNVSIWGIAGM